MLSLFPKVAIWLFVNVNAFMALSFKLLVFCLFDVTKISLLSPHLKTILVKRC